MTSNLRNGIIVSLVVIVLGQPSFAATVPPVPPEINVPAGAQPFLTGQAVGTQNYVCLPSTTGFSWTLFTPQATLFLTLRFFGNEVQQQVTTHFFSPNPAEGGTVRATWQSSLDTSAVWGAAIATSTDPNFVAPNAIPWLLIQAVGAQRGPTGGAFLTQTSFIQRINTSGGRAPSTGCSQSTNVGATAFVPYTADYIFYKGGVR